MVGARDTEQNVRVSILCVCVLSQTFPQQTLFIFPSHRFNFHSSLIFIIGTNKKIEDKKNPIIPKWYSFD